MTQIRFTFNVQITSLWISGMEVFTTYACTLRTCECSGGRGADKIISIVEPKTASSHYCLQSIGDASSTDAWIRFTNSTCLLLLSFSALSFGSRWSAYIISRRENVLYKNILGMYVLFQIATIKNIFRSSGNMRELITFLFLILRSSTLIPYIKVNDASQF